MVKVQTKRICVLVFNHYRCNQENVTLIFKEPEVKEENFILI